jgi:dTDP-4-amino-4,6-dideoxygalactose transaminase
MLVSAREDVLAFARAFRDYGKPDHRIAGLNFRMNEFTSAVGLVEVERLDEIAAWKKAAAHDRLDGRYPARVELPDGMSSGYYKYIVFEPIERSTGKVYDTPCHRITGSAVDLPNTDWVAQNHWCVPLYYRPEEGPEDALVP